jgi:methionyl-tRNA synthetase
MASYYITTPIYYVNDRPHIGHAYTTIAADVLARFHRLRGDQTFFLTGVDEHSLNVLRAARREGIAPQDFCDRMAPIWQRTWADLDITHDDFIRTSEPRHQRSVVQLIGRVRQAGDIYEGVYEGLYCVSCEHFYLERDLVDGRCPFHPSQPLERIEEKNQFFRLSAYGDRLREHLLAHPGFVQPEARRNEVLALIDRGLADFSISRQSVEWGIPFPDAPGQVVYVWFDALANYLTAVGYASDDARFRRQWPADLHLIGQDIVRFHALYWPAMLMSAELPLPRTVFAHGFLKFQGRRFSKSEGVILSPYDLAGRFGPSAAGGASDTGILPHALDALRYVLLRQVPFGEDGEFSDQGVTERYNADLANDLGNLVHRSIHMLQLYCDGRIPAHKGGTDLEASLRDAFAAACQAVPPALERLDYSAALLAIWAAINRANRYIEEAAPWRLKRDGSSERLEAVLYHLLEAIRVTAVLVAPFLPYASRRMREQLGLHDAPTWTETAWGRLAEGSRVEPSEPLFPRLLA